MLRLFFVERASSLHRQANHLSDPTKVCYSTPFFAQQWHAALCFAINDAISLMTSALVQLIGLILAISAYIASRLALTRVIARLSDHKDVSPARKAYVSKALHLGLFLVFFSVILLVAGIGYGELSVFLSSVFAVIGIALFATWSILSNLTASLIIFFAFPYRVGHRIKVVDKDEDIQGVIQSIEPFHVLILRDRGDVVTYPNNLILQKAVIRLDDGPTDKPEQPESD